MSQKWDKVAEILGVEVGEVFGIIDTHTQQKDKEHYKITKENGLMAKERYHLCWHRENEILGDILLGKYEIVSEPWKPKKGDTYWAIYGGGVINPPRPGETTWTGSVYDLMHYKHGCVYRTKEECERNTKSDYEKLTGEKWRW